MSSEKRQYKPLLHLPISSILSSSLGVFGKLWIKNGGKDIPRCFQVYRDTISIASSVPEETMKEGWQYIAKKVRLHHWKKSILKLKIDLDQGTTNQDVERIGDELSKNFTSLRHLKIENSKHAPLSDQRLKYLSKKTNRKLRQLQNLSINFGGWNSREKITLKNVGLFSRENTYHIQQLELQHLCGEMFNDVWLAKFIPGLSDYLKKLNILSIDFSSCDNITDQGISALGQGIATKFKALKELDLRFHHCKNIILEKVSLFGNNNEKIKISPTLDTLSLTFMSCWNITDVGFFKLMEDLGNVSHSLTDLSLRFKECYQMSNHSFEKLGCDYLQNFGNLERLLLNFKSSRGLVNYGVEVLANEGFKHLVKLKKLTLCLTDCKGVGDGGLRFLSDGIGLHLTQLENLSIYCWDLELSPEYLLEFVENITEKLKDLKNFNLNNLGFYRDSANEVVRNSHLKNFLETPGFSTYPQMSGGAELLGLRAHLMRKRG